MPSSLAGNTGAFPRSHQTRERFAFPRRVALIGLCGLLAGCASSPTCRIRYKLTFYSQRQPERLLATGVQEFWTNRVASLPGTTILGGLSGEAVPIRFSNGRIIFALLFGYSPGETVDHFGFLEEWDPIGPLAKAYRVSTRWSGSDNPGYRYLAAAGPGRIVELTRAQYPAFAVFERPHDDPSTGKLIDPMRAPLLDGDGVGRVTVQLTRKPVDRRLLAELPWLEDKAWRKRQAHGTYVGEFNAFHQYFIGR